MKYILLLLSLSCSLMKEKSHDSITSFRYQLQGYDSVSLDRITKSKNTLWVIDDTKATNTHFTKSEINKFKKNSNTLIAYLSLGEAEDYRAYFPNLPRELIIKQNPHWKGNYNIRYWRNQWRDIVNRRIDEMMEAGFDGVIFDVVDAFTIHQDKKLYANKMATLILDVASHAKKKNINFHIILQNAPVLFDHLLDINKSKLLSVISGASIESVLYPINGPYEQPRVTTETQNFIQSLKSSKKWIFSIEYLESEESISNYLSLMDLLGIYGLVTDRALKGEFFISNTIIK